jgi:hypothetical protein
MQNKTDVGLAGSQRQDGTTSRHHPLAEGPLCAPDAAVPPKSAFGPASDMTRILGSRYKA